MSAHLTARSLWARSPGRRNGVTAPVGLASDGTPTSITFSPSTITNVLVGGSAGNGKSSLLRLLVAGILREHGPDRVQVAGVDRKRAELLWLTDSPHLIERVATDDDAEAALVERVERTIELRCRQLQQAGAVDIDGYNLQSDRPLPLLLLVVDELLEAPNLMATLSHVMTYGADVGVHVLATTQIPSALPYDVLLRASARIALRTATVDDSVAMLGDRGAVALPAWHALMGSGGGGTAQRFHAPWISDDVAASACAH